MTRQLMPAVKARTLAEVNEMVAQFDVVAIDEGQFFEDIVEITDKWANQGKIVVVAALDATFERKVRAANQPFGRVCELVAIAETVQKLSAVCLSCSEWAYFTLKLDGSRKDVTDIGGIEKYHPVCRACHNSGNGSQAKLINK